MKVIDSELLKKWGAHEKEFSVDEIIFSEGSPEKHFHQLVSGSVRWTCIDSQGNEFIHEMIEPGEWFGELTTDNHQTNAASAIANCSSIVLRLRLTTFLELIPHHPKVLIALNDALNKRLHYKFKLTHLIATEKPEQILLWMLWYFKKNKSNVCTKCNRVMLTRQQLANMTGLRVETVIRSIKHLEEDGFLFIERGKVFC